MNTYIQSLGAIVCDVVEEEYKKPPTVITKDQKMKFTCNVEPVNPLLSSLPESKLLKVTDCSIEKSLWDKISSYYEGDKKVNQDKIQGFRIQFESLNMYV